MENVLSLEACSEMYSLRFNTILIGILFQLQICLPGINKAICVLEQACHCSMYGLIWSFKESGSVK